MTQTQPQPQPERALSDQTPPPADPTAPASSPFGTPNPAPGADGSEPQRPLPPTVSIVDTILDLDSLLSAEVRRAETTARIFLEADREARIDELDAELLLLTDSLGRPLPGCEDQAYAVAVELQTEQAAYGKSARSVRMRQMPSDDFEAFLTRHKSSDREDRERPPEFWNELIAASAVAPPMTVEQVKALRKKFGRPQMTVLGNKAWQANAESGVSIPKSSISSAVLRRGAPSTN